MPTLAVLTSGGDAPGMNAAVVAATKLATGRGWAVVGVRDGYDGLIAGRMEPLVPREVDAWWARGGTELGSARSAAFLEPEGRARAAGWLRGVDGLMVIGGNGSLAGARALHQEHGVRVVGLPASIDHDLACTSHAIGVDTALNTIVAACDRISDTARSHHRVFIVEVMGRQCGFLAMAGGIAAAADAVLFPEAHQGEADIVARLREVVRRSRAPGRDKKRVLVLKAEGVPVPVERLAAALAEHLAVDAPGVSVRTTVLGHVVRGGAPSFRDRLVASRLAMAGVSALAAGVGGVMAGWEPTESGGQPSADPAIQLFDLGLVLQQTEALLDGSHPTTRRRVAMLDAVSGVLPL
jgi:6-phosphofructokinase 1